METPDWLKEPFKIDPNTGLHLPQYTDVGNGFLAPANWQPEPPQWYIYRPDAALAVDRVQPLGASWSPTSPTWSFGWSLDLQRAWGMGSDDDVPGDPEPVEEEWESEEADSTLDELENFCEVCGAYWDCDCA